METDNEDIDLNQISVEALQAETRDKLSCMLNRPKVLLSPQKYQRDYRGLSDLMEINLRTLWLPNNDYIQKLLSMWVKQKQKEANLGKLQEYFAIIDRYDVLDDTHEMFVQNAMEYIRKACAIVNGIPDPIHPSEDVLTIADVKNVKEGGSLQLYDAFLLYVSTDEKFAELVLKTLEGPRFKLRLCDKNRDFVGGIKMEHCAIIKMISDRCRKLLVILSPEFMQCETHTYFVGLTQSMNFDQRGISRVIPCIYKDCPLSDDFRAYHVLDYRRANGLVDFWEKLYSSIVPLNPELPKSRELQVRQYTGLCQDTENPAPTAESPIPSEMIMNGNYNKYANVFKTGTGSKKSVVNKISNIWRKKKPHKAIAVAAS